MTTIALTHPKHDGKANVAPDQVAIWEAQGWVAQKPKAKTKQPKANEPSKTDLTP